ncbi:MAG: LysR family transcriptional regulator [Herminiimonas sp.]|nr:LysR family transcriptional regulator [Herminiimonas sp.]
MKSNPRSLVTTGVYQLDGDVKVTDVDTVTNQILALETHYRIKLLNRTTRRMSVTEEGR